MSKEGAVLDVPRPTKLQPIDSEILSKIPVTARQQMREYFAECAGKVREKGQEWQRLADRQKRDADILHTLATV